MRYKAHTLVNSDADIERGNFLKFWVWSTQGTGMVNVCGMSDSQMLTLEAAREYWKKCVTEFGMKPGPVVEVG